jgi:hypothetical protein
MKTCHPTEYCHNQWWLDYDRKLKILAKDFGNKRPLGVTFKTLRFRHLETEAFPFLLAVGCEDKKFKPISERMYQRIDQIFYSHVPPDDLEKYRKELEEM